MNDDNTNLSFTSEPSGKLDEALPGSVVPLRRLHNFRVTQGDPDIRGWDVVGADGSRIGEVDDLLVETGALRVRYLDVILDSRLLAGAAEPAESAGPIPGPEAAGGPGYMPNATATMGGLAPMITETMVRGSLSPLENSMSQGAAAARHVLIPIGHARLDAGHDRVLVEGMPSSQAAGLPLYSGAEVTRDYETGLRRHFDRDYDHAEAGDFYSHSLYDQDRFYSARRAAGLAKPGAPSGRSDREITGELDRAVETDAEMPVRGR